MLKDHTNACGLSQPACLMKPFVDVGCLRHVPCGQCFRPAQPYESVTHRLLRSPRCLAYTRSTTTCQRRLQLTARSLHRNRVPIVAAVREAPTPNMNKKGSSWVPSGVLLAFGGAMPGLLLASNWQQVISRCNTVSHHLVLVRQRGHLAWRE